MGLSETKKHKKHKQPRTRTECLVMFDGLRVSVKLKIREKGSKSASGYGPGTEFARPLANVS